MTKAAQLRNLLKGDRILKVAGAHNALGAKIIERYPFDAVWASGFEIATAHGVPDANILTMTEMLNAAINISTATHLPVICDCDTGYGNAVNVKHMVQKFESIGIAAVVIEDKLFPKMNSFIPGRQDLASIEEFCGKLEAAREGRITSSGILIFARVEALIAGWGIEEAYKRAVAYCEAGADGIVIHSKSKTPQEISDFAALWKNGPFRDCPLVSIPTTYYAVTEKELQKLGFKIVIYANQGIRASVRAMDEIFKKIAEEETAAAVEKNIVPMSEIFHLQGMTIYQEDEKKYSPNRKEPVSVVIPAAADHRYQPDLSSLLQDKPLCMLQVGKKTLLEQQLNMLRSVGISKAKVVVGYKKDMIKADGVEFVYNESFETQKSAYSIMLGLEKNASKTLVCYSDIIFDKQIPELLLQSPYSITIVMDRAFRSLPRRDKKLDLVLTDKSVQERPARKIEFERFKQICDIGKNVNVNKANYEFIGMMLVSKEGLEILKSSWDVAQKEYKNRPFYEAKDISSASMTDLLRFLIERGTNVWGLIIEHGWSELYSLDDYKRIDEYFSQKNKVFSPVYS